MRGYPPKILKRKKYKAAQKVFVRALHVPLIIFYGLHPKHIYAILEHKGWDWHTAYGEPCWRINVEVLKNANRTLKTAQATNRQQGS